MAFNPKDYMMDMRGKDYLEVKWRIVWFREEHPNGSILTEIVNFDPLVAKAVVVNGEGVTLGTGHGTPKMMGVAKARPFEGAETAAIGRALAVAGYGTQFTGEEEGEHLADGPIEPVKASAPQRPYDPETLKAGFTAKFDRIQGGDNVVTQGQKGALVGRYNEILGGDTERYEVMEFLYGVRSSKDLEPVHVLVGLSHLNGEDPEMAKRELIQVRDYVRKQNGQQELI